MVTVARSVVAGIGLGVFAFLAIHLYVFHPLDTEGSFDAFYSPLSPERVSYILWLGIAWAGFSLALVAGLFIRLRARSTWALNAPFSVWRTLRSSLLAIGLICATVILPAYVLGSAPIVQDSVEQTRRGWELGLGVYEISLIATGAAFLMYLIGGMVRLVLYIKRELRTE